MPPSPHDFDRLHDFYSQSLNEYGTTDARSVQWADARNQRIRFEVLLQMLPRLPVHQHQMLPRHQIKGLSDASISVLDFGCGLGDLYKFFLEKQIQVNYTGLDIMPEFIAIARQRFPEATFLCQDIFEFETDKSLPQPLSSSSPAPRPLPFGSSFDYVLASGALSFKLADTDHADFYKKVITKLYSLATKGLAFNMLDNSIHIDDETYAAYSPHEIGDFCKTLGDHVEIVTGYLPQDFTLYIYKPQT